jgi:hypothetical protein
MGLEVQGKTNVNRNYLRISMTKRIFSFMRDLRFSSRVADNYTLLWCDTTQMNKHTSKVRTNTVSLSSWMSKFPRGDVLRHFVYGRRGRKLLRYVAIQLPKDAASCPRRTKYFYSFTFTNRQVKSSLCLLRHVPLYSLQYHVIQEASLGWKLKKLDGIQQSCW